MADTIVTRYDGDDWEFDFSYTSATKVPIDITGYNIVARVYPPNSVVSSVELEGSPNIDVTSPTTGNFTVIVPNAYTKSPTSSSTDRIFKVRIILIGTTGLRKTLAVLQVKAVPI